MISLLLLLMAVPLMAHQERISVANGPDGSRLMVDGRPFMVNGMNWDYFPVGTNYSYSLWTQPADVIKSALDNDMSLLKNMGVNAIRQHAGVPAAWVRYIYEKYGIYTMIYSSFGRYGMTIDGTWVANTDYSDPRVEPLLMEEARNLVREYDGTPGILLYLLGNENNYGLFWQGAETEDIPVEDRKSTKQAVSLYRLFNKAAVEMKEAGASYPIAICNGDLLFLDIIARECKDIDILGINCYRGESFGDLFSRVRTEYGKPVLFTEFGSDAFNAVTQEEAQKEQADILLKNWTEIYLNAAEAGMELGGEYATQALNYVNLVRQRAGLGANSWTAADLTIDNLLNERRRELALEDHRLWDMKRLRRAHRVWNGVESATTMLYALYPYRIVGGPDNNKYIYVRKIAPRFLAPRNFRIGNYYTAFEQDVLDKNPKLVQNPNM